MCIRDSTVTDYSGNAGDSLSFHNGMMFSTYDRDNDLAPQGAQLDHCANYLAGGFWFNNCCKACITVMKGRGNSGFSWHGLPTTGKELKSASMWITCWNQILRQNRKVQATAVQSSTAWHCNEKKSLTSYYFCRNCRHEWDVARTLWHNKRC